MVSTNQLLYRAKFKGARFLPTGPIITGGGRKLIDHTYPNSERRFLEDLGLMQRDFTLTGIVQGPNYFAKRDALIKALESSESGRLVHPFFGSIIVKARPYSLIESLKEINIGTFTMGFGVSTDVINPIAKGLPDFGALIDKLRSALDDVLAIEFKLPFADTILAADNLMTDVFDKFDDLSRNFNQIGENITALKKVISDARDKIAQIIRTPNLLSKFLEDVFNAINNLFDDPEETLNALRDLFGFQGGNTTKPSTTFIREAENDNNELINVSINLLALSNSYMNASLIEYQSDEQLVAIVEVLEEQFDSIVERVNDPVLGDILDIRDQFRQLTEQLLITVDKVKTINVEKTSVTSLVHRYYGNTDRYDQIIELNNILNPSEVSGAIKILAN